MRLAEEGLGFLSSTVDTLIVIPNQNLFQLVDKQTSLLDSFRCAVDVDFDVDVDVDKWMDGPSVSLFSGARWVMRSQNVGVGGGM